MDNSEKNMKIYNNTTKTYIIKKYLIVLTFLYFVFLARIYVLFYPYSSNFKSLAPTYIVVIRDIVSILILIFTFLLFLLKKLRISKVYIKELFLFIIYYMFFSLISLIHLLHIPVLQIVQHNLRNFVFYMAIGLLLPVFYIKSIYFFEKIINKIIIFSLFIVFLGIAFQYYFVPNLFEGRLLSTFENPNTYGNFTIFILLLVIHKIFTCTKKRKVYFFIFMFNFIALLLTGSFQNIFGFFFGIGILLFFIYKIYYKNMRLKLLKRVFLITLFFLFVFFMLYVFSLMNGVGEKLNNVIVSRFNNIFISSNSTSTSVTGRIYQLHYIIKYIKSTKLLDLLFGNFSISRYLKFDSQYYQIIVNNGLLLFIWFILLFIIFFRKIIKFLKTAKKKDYTYKLIETNFLPISVYLLFIIIYSNFFTAILNRYPINFLFGFCIAYITHFKLNVFRDVNK